MVAEWPGNDPADQMCKRNAQPGNNPVHQMCTHNVQPHTHTMCKHNVQAYSAIGLSGCVGCVIRGNHVPRSGGDALNFNSECGGQIPKTL